MQAAERILAKACQSMLMSPMLQSNGIVRGEVVLSDSKEILVRQIGQTTWEVNTPIRGGGPGCFSRARLLVAQDMAEAICSLFGGDTLQWPDAPQAC